MSMHTPGPWFTTRPTSYGTIYVEARLRGSTLQEVASVGPTETSDQQEANGRLIAAAPELLKALRELVALEADGKHASESSIEPWERARAAIAKATGESQ